MTWSMSYSPPQEPELLDALFLSAGRSLHIANAFEEKCRWMVRCINLVEVHENADPVATFEDIIAGLPADKMLGPTLQQLTGHLSCSAETMDALRRARRARNFIAHEGAGVGDISVVRERHILAHACRLRSAVSDLAAGDNIVSQWGFHFEEPRWSLPRDLVDAYPKMIDEWIFGHFGNLLDEAAASALTERPGPAQQPPQLDAQT
ncbi:hypothetical protein J7E99_32610 [Streptomyces sp. ISL-44]|uniref:hypothetical protein n=1 Tax=Streptomyces sp. ISL-44 TaxID=2819184 RepID=UPI001BE82F60|nr:hypothetical protein [Streptomyces sp. ISL-44]MBT2545314.1 hypothetical protein [Streptomyces sp. ISL-44]